MTPSCIPALGVNPDGTPVILLCFADGLPAMCLTIAEAEARADAFDAFEDGDEARSIARGLRKLAAFAKHQFSGAGRAS